MASTTGSEEIGMENSSDRLTQLRNAWNKESQLIENAWEAFFKELKSKLEQRQKDGLTGIESSTQQFLENKDLAVETLTEAVRTALNSHLKKLDTNLAVLATIQGSLTEQISQEEESLKKRREEWNKREADWNETIVLPLEQRQRQLMRLWAKTYAWGGAWVLVLLLLLWGSASLSKTALGEWSHYQAAKTAQEQLESQATIVEREGNLLAQVDPKQIFQGKDGKRYANLSLGQDRTTGWVAVVRKR